MLRPVQLAGLAETLARHGYAVSTHQVLSASDLMARLRKRIAVDDLAPWLAPVFCSNAEQQQKFDGIYRNWLRGQEAPDSDPDRVDRDPPAGRGAATAPPVSIATVLRAQASLLPLALIVMALAITPLWPPASLDTPAPGMSTDSPGPAASGSGRFRAELQTVVQAPPPAVRPVVPTSDQPGKRTVQVAAIGVLVLHLCWMIQQLRRRGFLERQAPDGRQTELRFRGRHRPALLCLREELGQLGRILRRRTPVPSRELDVGATVAAYRRRGVVLDLVFGRRCEPEYLVLVDKAGRHDHYGRIADEAVRLLHDRSGVIVDQYMFNGDPRRSRQQSLRDERRLSADIYTLESLLVRHPQARLLIFSDGKGLIDTLSGRPVGWLPVLLQWPEAVLVTPRPAESWSVREWLLSRAGLKVVPMDGDGLTSLGRMLTAGHADPGAPTGASRRATPLYLREVSTMLDTVAPSPEQREQLLNALWEDLGVEGFVWLCGCAAYPEIHWEITLAIGRALMKHPGKRELDREHTQLLIRLSALPWLRHGFMPDWLRESLLSSLDERETALVRTALADYLGSAALEMASGASATLAIRHHVPAGFWSDVRRGAAAFLNRRTQPGVLEDGVYLRFMSGRPPQLSVSAGDRIARFFFQHGSALARPRMAPYAVALGAMVLALPYFGTPARPQRDVMSPAPRAIAFDAAGTGSAFMLADELGRIRVASMAPTASRGAVGVAAAIPIDDTPDFMIDGRLDLDYANPVLRMAGRRAQDGRPIARGWGFRGGYEAQDIASLDRNADYLASPFALQADTFGQAAEGELQLESRELQVAQGTRLCAAFSSKTKQMIVADSEMLSRITGQPGMPAACAVSTGVKSLAIGIGRTIYVYPLTRSGGAPVMWRLGSAGAALRDIAVSDDGRVISAIVDGKLHYRRDNEQLTLDVRPAPVGPLAMSGDGRHVAVADGIRRTQVWRIQPAEQVATAVSDALAEERVAAANAAAAAAAAVAAANAAVPVSAPTRVAPREQEISKAKKRASEKPATGSAAGTTLPSLKDGPPDVPTLTPRQYESTGNQGPMPSSPANGAPPAEPYPAAQSNAAENYRIVATSRLTGRSGSMGAEHAFSFRLAEPAEKLVTIERVVYRLDDPTFKQKDYVSTNRSSGFSQGYRGWGCLPDVLVTIYYRDRTTRELHWNMCESLAKWEREQQEQQPAYK